MNPACFKTISVQVEIECLLKLQSLDKAKHDSELSFTRAPEEIASIDAKIKQEEQQLLTVKKILSEKEKLRDDCEKETKKAEEQLIRLKGQQALVKKVDEFEAINKEIEQTIKKISDFEDKELMLIDEIEEEKKTVAFMEKAVAHNMQNLRDERKAVEARIQKSKETFDAINTQLDEQRKQCDPVYLQAYDRVRKNVTRLPCVVPFRDSICGGCHMKTSQSANALKDASKLHYCEQCGRILYVE